MAENQNTNNTKATGGFFSKIGGRLKDTVGKGMGAVAPKVTEIAGKVGDKLESTADKIAHKIPGGEHLQEAASNMVEKGVSTIGEQTKGMVESGKQFVNDKIDQGQQAVEKKSGSIIGEITDKVHEVAAQGVGAVENAAGKATDMLGAGVEKAQDAAKQGVEMAEKGVTQATDAATNVVEKAENQAMTAAETVKEKTVDIAGQVQEHAETAAKTVVEKAEDVKDQVVEKVEDATKDTAK